MKTNPKALDLFCGAGGASMGLHRAGFDVTGVDINHQPEYPFFFLQADALTIPLDEFDFIWASPPCQHFTKYGNVRKNLRQKYEDLIVPTRIRLIAGRKPFVIENVVGCPLETPIQLCGSMFGLDIRRHRLFEATFPIIPPACNHAIWEPNRFPGGRSRERGHARILCRGTVEIGRWNIPIKTQQNAMGINWINDLRMLSESIPPAYSEFIASQYFASLVTQAAE